jgi:hypothetical protein
VTAVPLLVLRSLNGAGQHGLTQDFQTFLDPGGHIGLQHDPLLYGAYALNPFLVGVELVPMLMVKQGQVAVIKFYVGLATQDTSQVWFAGSTRASRRLAGAAAYGEVSSEPALLPGGNRANGDFESELSGRCF